MSAGDWALFIAAIAWAVLVLFLAILSISVFRVLTSTRVMIDSIRTETVPLLSEVRTTVTSVNRELENADRLVVSAANITGTVERVSKLIELFVSTPLIKAISYGYGAQRALRRFQGEK